MIRVDVDKEPAINSRYNLDGAYIPRTIAVEPSGKVIQKAYAPTANHRYFIGIHESDLLRFMKSIQNT